MTKAKAKPQQAAEKVESMAYCGPSIRGIATQYQVFINGIPSELKEAISKKPVLAAFIVPLAEMPEVRRSINSGAGKWAALFESVKGVK